MPYESHVTTSPVFASPARITYPFANQGDLTTKIVHQPLLQLSDRYAPPTLGTAFVGATDANLSGSPVTIGSAYCIGDTEPQPAESGLVSFTRMWANIPATRTVPIGSTILSVVGLAAGAAGASKTITAATFGASSAVFTSAAHGYSVATMLKISISYTLSGAPQTNTFSRPITAADANTFTIGSIYFSGCVFVSGTAQSSAAARSPFSAKTTAFIRYKYALAGVTSGISIDTDFAPDDSFSPFNTTSGALVTTLDTATTPTGAEYRAMIASGSFIVSESNISLWMGKIMESATVMIKAI